MAHCQQNRSLDKHNGLHYLTDYWVSQARKYCEFCKCSIADNKPSIQSHENGKKHKENVRLRLAEMQKKAAKEASTAKAVEKQMKKMEEAAMQAYLKDIETNPDFTSQIIKETLDVKNEAIRESLIRGSAKKAEPIEKTDHIEKPAKKVHKKKWIEAKAAEGHSYYWHVETGESVWEAPKHGYLSIEEQEAQGSSDQNPIKMRCKKESKKTVQELNKEIYGMGGSKSSKPTKCSSSMIGPSNRSQPYGSWTPAVKEEDETLDLELPDVKPKAMPVVSIAPNDGVKVFKEKKASADKLRLQGDGEVVFKKRKLGAGVRNTRQRGDND